MVLLRGEVIVSMSVEAPPPAEVRTRCVGRPAAGSTEAISCTGVDVFLPTMRSTGEACGGGGWRGCGTAGGPWCAGGGAGRRPRRTHRPRARRGRPRGRSHAAARDDRRSRELRRARRAAAGHAAGHAARVPAGRVATGLPAGRAPWCAASPPAGHAADDDAARDAAGNALPAGLPAAGRYAAGRAARSAAAFRTFCRLRALRLGGWLANLSTCAALLWRGRLCSRAHQGPRRAGNRRTEWLACRLGAGRRPCSRVVGEEHARTCRTTLCNTVYIVVLQQMRAYCV